MAETGFRKFHRIVPLVTFFKSCSQNFDPSINMSLVNEGFLHYTDIKKFLNRSSSPKPLVRFWNNLQKCYSSDLSQKLLAKFWFVIEHGSSEWGLLSLYGHEQVLKKSLKLLVRFWNNFTEMFLRWPFPKVFPKFWSVNKHDISEWGLLALYGHKEILVNSSLKVTEKIGYGHLKNSGERSRAIQGLLFLQHFPEPFSSVTFKVGIV